MEQSIHQRSKGFDYLKSNRKKRNLLNSGQDFFRMIKNMHAKKCPDTKPGHSNIIKPYFTQ